MPACTGNVCWKEKCYFHVRNMTNLGAAPTDNPPGPVLVREDLIKVATASTEWREKVKTERYDPPGTDPAANFSYVTFKKECEPAASCKCSYYVRRQHKTIERFVINVTYNNKKYDITFSVRCYVDKMLGVCVSKRRRIVKYVDEEYEQLVAMNLDEVIDFVKPYLDYSLDDTKGEHEG